MRTEHYPDKTKKYSSGRKSDDWCSFKDFNGVREMCDPRNSKTYFFFSMFFLNRYESFDLFLTGVAVVHLFSSNTTKSIIH